MSVLIVLSVLWSRILGGVCLFAFHGVFFSSTCAKERVVHKCWHVCEYSMQICSAMRSEWGVSVFFPNPLYPNFRVRFFSKSPVPKLSENYQASLKSRENCVFTLTDWGVACCTDHTASPVHSLHPPPSAQCTTHICCWLFSSWLRITHWKHRHARNGRHSSRLCMPHSSFQSLSFSILTLQLNVGLACSKCDWRLTHLTFLLVVSVFMLSKCSLLLSVSSVFERWWSCLFLWRMPPWTGCSVRWRRMEYIFCLLSQSTKTNICTTCVFIIIYNI